MSRLDCSSAEVKAALEEVSNPSSKNDWAVFGYVPKSGNVLKVDATGNSFDEMVEELSEGKVQFGYWRTPVKNTPKFVYIAWCGDGVVGMMKGSFANHSSDFSAFLKKGFAVHHQVNARNETDLDEKKIQAALVKAGGANYDAGAKQQGHESVAKQLGDLKVFHVSEQQRANETGRSGAANVAIDKTASDQFWAQNKAQPKAPAAAPSRPDVDESARKAFWAKQQEERAAAQQAQQQQQSRPAVAANAGGLRNKFEQASAPPPKTSAPAPRPAPGKLNSPFANQAPSSAPPKTSAPPPGRPAPSGPPSLPPSGPPKLPPSAPPSGPPSLPPSVPSAAPPRPAPVSAPLPPRQPEPDVSNDDDWDDEPAAPVSHAPPALPPPASVPAPAPAPAQEEYAQEEYAQEEYAQEEYAQEEYAQEEYAQEEYQEEYAQEEYAQEEYAQEEYAQEEYGQEEYAQEEYAQEEYAQEEYAQEEYGGQEQVQALHDYAGSHAEDLTFSAGDWIVVIEKDESGWWKGSVHGKTGYFPSNFVQQ